MEINKKICKQCFLIKTKENFYHCNKTLSGLKSKCKECEKKNHKVENDSRKTIVNGMKICTKCKIEKSINNFTKRFYKSNEGIKETRYSNCKECVRKKSHISNKKYSKIKKEENRVNKEARLKLKCLEKDKLRKKYQLNGSKEKKCIKCNHEKFLEEFYLKKSNNKYSNVCLACKDNNYNKLHKREREYFKIIDELHKDEKLNHAERYKLVREYKKQEISKYRQSVIDSGKLTCIECDIEKDFNCFMKNNKSWNGHNAICIECRNKYVNEFDKKYPEKAQARRLKYYINNPEIFAFSNKYRLEQIKQTPKNLKLTFEQWNLIVDHYNHSCAYCKKKIKSPEVEHVIPLFRNGTHTTLNIVPSCSFCNR